MLILQIPDPSGPKFINTGVKLLRNMLLKSGAALLLSFKEPLI